MMFGGVWLIRSFFSYAKESKETHLLFGCREARRANSALRANNIDDLLHEVLKPDGGKCELFPRDLKVLFGYDGVYRVSPPSHSKLITDY